MRYDTILTMNVRAWLDLGANRCTKMHRNARETK